MIDLRHSHLPVLLAALILLVPLAHGGKIPVTRKDDLPRHSYQLELPVTGLYLDQNRPVLLALAGEVRGDIEKDLATYDIRDDNTLQEFYAVLGTIAALEGRWEDYLELLSRRRELESKEANRLTMGLYGEALATALRCSSS